MLDGFQGGRLYTIAGRPGMGKTGLGLSIANAANCKTLFVTLEMSTLQISVRLLQMRLGKNLYLARGQELDEFIHQNETKDNLTFWEPDGKMQVAELEQIVDGFEFVVVDYLGLIGCKGQQSRAYEVKEITTALKQLAKKKNIPVVLLCQLNRMSESDSKPQPKLSDLKDSGGVEEDSDVVIGIYRPVYYEQQKIAATPNERLAREKKCFDLHNLAYLLVLKNRDGACGNVECRFIPEIIKFESVDT
jgi:replicative DNA helicase